MSTPRMRRTRRAQVAPSMYVGAVELALAVDQLRRSAPRQREALRESIFRQWAHPVRRIVTRYQPVLDTSETDDVINRTFSEFFRVAEVPAFESSHAARVIVSRARRRSINLYEARRKRRDRFVPCDTVLEVTNEPSPTPDRIAEVEEIRRLLFGAFRHAPRQERQVARLVLEHAYGDVTPKLLRALALHRFNLRLSADVASRVLIQVRNRLAAEYRRLMELEF